MNYVQTFESFIYESSVAEITNGKPVVFFPGRFQPVHNGHLAALKRTSDEFGLPVIPLQIVSKNEDSPIPDSLLIKMGADVVKAHSYIEDFLIYPSSYGRTVIPWFVRFLRSKGYEPQGLGCGSDRLKDYTTQIAYITGPKTDTRVEPGFSVKMVDARDSDGASGTKVRAAIRSNNQREFEQMMPKELWKYWDELSSFVK